MIPNGDNEAFLSVCPIRGNLTVPTEPDWGNDDRSMYSIKLIIQILLSNTCRFMISTISIYFSKINESTEYVVESIIHRSNF